MADRGAIINSYRATQSIGAFLVVAVAATTTAFNVELADTATSAQVGISQDSASTNGAISILELGRGKAICGASVSAGAILSWQTATGKVVAVTNNTFTTFNPVIGRALESGTLDSRINILVNPGLLGSQGL